MWAHVKPFVPQIIEALEMGGGQDSYMPLADSRQNQNFSNEERAELIRYLQKVEKE